MMAVYVPTNHLYLGDIVLYPRERALFPDISGRGGHSDFSDRRDVAAGSYCTQEIAPRNRSMRVMTFR